ncbi:unnamed protein product, partial [Closterium sp. NIES-54]
SEAAGSASVSSSSLLSFAFELSESSSDPLEETISSRSSSLTSVSPPPSELSAWAPRAELGLAPCRLGAASRLILPRVLPLYSNTLSPFSPLIPLLPLPTTTPLFHTSPPSSPISPPFLHPRTWFPAFAFPSPPPPPPPPTPISSFFVPAHPPSHLLLFRARPPSSPSPPFSYPPSSSPSIHPPIPPSSGNVASLHGLHLHLHELHTQRPLFSPNLPTHTPPLNLCASLHGLHLQSGFHGRPGGLHLTAYSL